MFRDTPVRCLVLGPAGMENPAPQIFNSLNLWNRVIATRIRMERVLEPLHLLSQVQKFWGTVLDGQGTLQIFNNREKWVLVPDNFSKCLI